MKRALPMLVEAHLHCQSLDLNGSCLILNFNSNLVDFLLSTLEVFTDFLHIQLCFLIFWLFCSTFKADFTFSTQISLIS